MLFNYEKPFKQYLPQSEKTIMANVTALNETMKQSDSIAYCETDISEYIKSQFLMVNIKNKRSVFGKSIRLARNITLNQDTIFNFVCEHMHKHNKKLEMVMTRLSSRYTIITDKTDILMVTVSTSSTSVKLSLSGDLDIINMLERKITDIFEIVNCSVEWITTADMNCVTIPLVQPRGITDASYPFITEGLDKFIFNYLNGSENVLILIGAPGTGKTNLTKYIISQSHRDAMITYDPVIMAKDAIFANFTESDCGTLVFEDADNLLGMRSEGNEIMVKFLNSSDGLVSNPGKKIIFSTNLENLDNVDKALLRPGRCAGVICFRPLTYQETINFLDTATDITWKPTDSTKTYTLADIYNTVETNRIVNKRITGFY